MKKNKMLRIPLTLTFLACFVVFAITANYNSVSVPAVASVGDKPLIVLDAGHGGLDSGCVGINGELEKDINLAIVKNLEQVLLFSGFEVVLTRSEDISIYDNGVEGIRNQKVSDMENRKKIVQSYPDSIFISVHQNQFTQPEYFGAQMFYTTKNKDNFRLAQIMQNCFRELHPENNREVKLIDNDLYLFKETQQPALLVECGFLSNQNDAKNLSDKEYQKKVAFSVYKGLLQFLNEAQDVQQGEAYGETGETLYMQ